MLTEFVAGKTQPLYKATSVYQEDGGKWSATPIDPPLRRVLHPANANTILEPSQTPPAAAGRIRATIKHCSALHGKTMTVFDEQAAYKNPDYDVSFYTQNGSVARPRCRSLHYRRERAAEQASTACRNKGKPTRKNRSAFAKRCLDLPAAEVKSVEDSPRRIAFLPHAELVGWISDKEMLVAEGPLLVAYNVANGTRRKSNIRVRSAAQVFLE